MKSGVLKYKSRPDAFLVRGPDFKDQGQIHDGPDRNSFFLISGTAMDGVYNYNIRSEEYNCTCSRKATVFVSLLPFMLEAKLNCGFLFYILETVDL